MACLRARAFTCWGMRPTRPRTPWPAPGRHRSGARLALQAALARRAVAERSSWEGMGIGHGVGILGRGGAGRTMGAKS